MIRVMMNLKLLTECIKSLKIGIDINKTNSSLMLDKSKKESHLQQPKQK